ncbi:aspartate-semialdehyde dehydrogenase [Gluconobacter wancherniae]|uniref:Aspartate-semialdehyde dehydrogenase n=1 Tax=Gluconobacter wancherniae NBRC 103581 TaxID=656744 RepID=A0A511B078_9PROT|nr:aspartate-semialdehyde dehydrogenase [Gluconobacter wancherniae]MBF0854309.1 aspartate-semialdehyde dehydrogenase [Gluconobacter wancherniae]GBD57369.1 aspartate-semialdehyde dehydrogenase [Gluconobacter wancherniae NBRC 103581]GBR62538.1 aspartate-semialdehyde dehydrogenase [Gluconobacter wancherniae NBRC 103581]GEK93856.1 aspartate-semialdehyde dehydrogenase [Gluconobacter wancherniae NBRC 103581]
MGYRVAVAGATGAVGRELLRILAERDFPVDEVVALASPRSVGREISFGEKKVLKVQNLETFDFTGWDLALFSPGGEVSAIYAPKAAAAGCVVIDNTSHFRMEPGIPLVVPEVNAKALKKARRGIIANPNCSTAQMMVALKPLHDLFKIKRIVVSTYQAVSGAGKDGMDELFAQTKGTFVNDPPTIAQFTKQIAFNVIPHIDRFMEDGSTKEEWKMAVETRKILDPDIQVMATCVRVPVFIGHSEAISIECEKPVDLKKARNALRKALGVILRDEREDGGYVTPIETVGEDATYVSRLRIDPSVENGLALWCVSDNLRKGAALNAVQIAESLVEQDLLKDGVLLPPKV